MTPLRQRMLGDLQLRGFSPRTQEAYLRAVRQLAAHFHRPPDQLGEADLREYFLYLTNVKRFARASFTIALCGIKFFYERTLSGEWKVFDLVRPAREKKLPAILSRDEVRRILACVRLPVYRACLTTIYVCGLRLQEGTQVQVADVDSGRGCCRFMARAGATGTCRCRSTPCRCCESTGAPIARRSGCFLRPCARAHATSSPSGPGPFRGRACSRRSAGRSGRAGPTNGPTCIPSGTPTPLICWKTG